MEAFHHTATVFRAQAGKVGFATGGAVKGHMSAYWKMDLKRPVGLYPVSIHHALMLRDNKVNGFFDLATELLQDLVDGTSVPITG